MPEKAEHELAIDEGVHVGDIDLVVETASFYRLSAREARAIVDEVRDALGSWRMVAASVQLGELEIKTLSDAIEAVAAPLTIVLRRVRHKPWLGTATLRVR